MKTMFIFFLGLSLSSMICGAVVVMPWNVWVGALMIATGLSLASVCGFIYAHQEPSK